MTKTIMFTTPSCGGCKIIKPLVLAKGLPIEIVDATEDKARAKVHGVSTAPVFVTENEDGSHGETLAVGAQEGIKLVNEL